MKIKSLIYDGFVNEENVNSFIYNFEQALCEPDNTKIIVYFSSGGGSLGYCEILLDFFKEMESAKAVVDLKAFGSLHSAGLLFFYRAPLFSGKKYILDGTLGLIHKMRLSLKEGTTTIDLEKGYLAFQEESVAEEDEKLYNFLKRAGFSKEEINLIKQGEDIYLNTTRLRFILLNDNLLIEKK